MPQVTEAQRDFSAGIVVDVGPHIIDPRAVRDHINGLYEEDGSAYKRGGSAAHSTQLASPASNPLSWLFDGYFDVGQRTVAASQSDFYVLASNDATLTNLGSDGLVSPKPSVLVESMLFIGGGYIYGGSRKTATYSTGTVALTQATYDSNGTCTNAAAAKTVTGTGTSFSANLDAGMLFQRGDERVYVIASVNSDTQLTLRDPYEGATGIGISYIAHHFYKVTTADPYEAGEFYAVVANRLVTATGNTLKFTEIKKPHKWTLTAGDPSAEIPNEHKFPEGGRVTGAGVIGSSLVVFTTAGIWTIEGMAFDIVDSQGDSNHRVQILSRELVAYGQTATWQQALIVPCISGIFLIDGVSAPRRLSHPIDELYRIYMSRNYQPGQAAVYRDHFVFPIISLGGEVKDILIARLDRPVKISGQGGFPWSRAGGTGIECPAFAVRHVTSADDSVLLGANKPRAQIIDCSGFWKPSDSNMTDVDGEPPEWILVTRDYETGGLTKNMVRTIRPRYELVGDGATITAEFGFGISEQGGFTWDEYDWADESATLDPDDLYWEDDEDDVYYDLACTFGESDGLNPKHCRINQDTRFIRYRFRNNTPCSRLRFRSLEQAIRRSAAVRR